MKKVMFVMFVALAFVGFAFAQSDILGPHNFQGHGCASCHAPHGGAAGLESGGDPSTGVNYLWGRDFYATTYTTFGGGTLVVGNSYSSTDTLFHTAACLSCHDGNAAVSQQMLGHTVESLPVTGYQPPSFLNKDGYSLANDHPVHVAYTPGGNNWPGTVTNGTITWTLTDQNVIFFYNNYGHPTRFYADKANNLAMVECSTCHNPHDMKWNKQTINNTSVVKPSAFFVRGWYDLGNQGSNSTQSFCRSCHYSKSNENVGQQVPIT